jgi:hypothetical protein
MGQMNFLNCSQTANSEEEETKDAHVKTDRTVLNLLIIILNLEAGRGL